MITWEPVSWDVPEGYEGEDVDTFPPMVLVAFIPCIPEEYCISLTKQNDCWIAETRRCGCDGMVIATGSFEHTKYEAEKLIAFQWN